MNFVLVEGVRSKGNGSAGGNVSGRANHARGNVTGLSAGYTSPSIVINI